MDKEFFKTGNIHQLESEDPHVRVNFISDETLAISWTRGPDSEVRWEEPLFLKAVFIEVKSGAVRFRQDWPMHKRRRITSNADSEGRIFPVHGGRFIVHANGELLLYSTDYRLTQKLELATPDGGYWSVTVLPGGKQLFLCYESPQGITYSWLSADNLQTLRTEPAPAKNARDVEFPFEEGFYIAVGKSLQAIPATEGPTITCEPFLCRNKAFPLLATVLNHQRVALLCSDGVAIYTRGGQLIWSKSGTDVGEGFGLAESLSTNILALSTFGEKGATLDGHPMPAGANYFLYDSDSPNLLFYLHLSREWESADALSPNGSKFAVLSGNQLQIYEVPVSGASQK
jgi:hypothetical protein